MRASGLLCVTFLWLKSLMLTTHSPLPFPDSGMLLRENQDWSIQGEASPIEVYVSGTIPCAVKITFYKSADLRDQNEKDSDTQKSGCPQTHKNPKSFGMGLLFWALTSLDIPNSNGTNYGKKAQHKANPGCNHHPKIYHKLFIFQIISPLPFPDSGIGLGGSVV